MSVVLDAFKDNQDHRILKIHLFDDSINVHGWGIDRELAASLAEEYAQGAPYLIPPTLNHPVRPYAPFLDDPIKDIEDIKRYASFYEAGKCFKTELCASNHSAFGYDGYIKLTDQKAIEAFDKGLIPRYSSVSIYNLSNRDRGLINKAQALNICAVRKPAYSNAELLGSCKGPEDTCHTNLKNAGVTTYQTSTNSVGNTITVGNPVTTKNDHYCKLKTLEKNNYKKFKSNTSLKQNSEIVASYSTMSATNNQQQQPQQQTQQPTTTQPVNTNPSVQPVNQSQVQPTTSQQTTVSPPVANSATTATEVTNVPQNQNQNQNNEQKPEQPQTQVQKPLEDVQAKEQVEEILDYKKLYEELKPLSEQKDALLVEFQKRINRYEKDQDALKIKEIDRFVTIDLFNGDSKTHAQKVKEWRDRAVSMGLEDLSWHLTESYGRKVYGEKKAGLNYEPTAVLSNPNSNVNQATKRFSIYDIGSVDLNKGGAY